MKEEFSIYVYGTVSDNELSELQQILMTTNIDWRVRNDSVQCKSFDHFEQSMWLIIVYIPFKKFIDTFAEQLAKDTYKEIKTFFKRLYKNRKKHTKSEGVVLLKDTETDNTYKLPMQLHDADFEMAVVKLLELDIGTIDKGLVEYLLDEKTWMPSDQSWNNEG